MLLLYSITFYIGTCTSSAFLRLSMPQNCFGEYFSICGRDASNLFFSLLHARLYSALAVSASVLSLPLVLRAYLSSFLNFLHSSVNHGAICFTHLFGFLALVISIFCMAPDFTASSIKKASTCAALSSFVTLVLLTSVVNYYMN